MMSDHSRFRSGSSSALIAMAVAASAWCVACKRSESSARSERSLAGDAGPQALESPAENAFAGMSAEQISSTYCGGCHKSRKAYRKPGVFPDPTVPELEYLARLPVGAIVMSLERGTMRTVGASLTPRQRIAVAELLTGQEYVPTASTGHYCPPDKTRPSGSELAGPSWRGWGNGPGNARFQPADVARLSEDQVARLKVKWAFALSPGRSGLPVAVHGSRLFLGDDGGRVRSLDRDTGCIHWAFNAPVKVRTAVVIRDVDSPAPGQPRQLALFATSVPPAINYAVDALTGDVVWQTDVVDHELSHITGSAQLHDGTLYVPVSVGVENHRAALDPKYPCCTGRGGLVAIDSLTGRVAWRSFVVGEPRPTRKNAAGTQMWGPSGASIWKVPAFDARLGRVYAGTSQNTSEPATDTSDAVVAFDIASGDIAWSRQFTEGDLWNAACSEPGGDKGNCPFVPYTPQGAGDVTVPLLVELEGGRRLLIAGDKTGIVRALDPDKDGALVWETRVGKGGTMGGIQWGMAADAHNVYVPLHDAHQTVDRKLGFVGVRRDPEAGALIALRLTDGRELWRSIPRKDSCAGKTSCRKALSSAPSVIPGVVFAGATDGYIRAYSTRDGRVLWEFDTVREFETVDGGKANGGTIDGPGGPVIVDGMLIITSGYGIYGGMPGNVLLAFTLDGT